MTEASLPPERFAKLRDWAITQIMPLVDTLHRGTTPANQQ